ncbi:FliI/YscN family ATPase [Mariprofundus ferrinatatus]|uniref:FliI/YscN family ATPase n=1 Tax=Mariprofundus ferrinatatus TaxID=1921087 RepID=UPI001E5EAF83|nr:FliI/YscN family ATPase [Mariprofundus ferrinatatus]
MREPSFPPRGLVQKVMGPMLEASGIKAEVGRACYVQAAGDVSLEAEIVGFRDGRSLIMPVGSTRGIAPGSVVQPLSTPPSIPVSDALLGRVLDSRGQPLDGRLLPEIKTSFPIHRRPPNPMLRHIIDTPMQLGVRVIDACMTMGWGQRMGLFAGAGVGKSTLLAMLAKDSDADVIVIALVGERGRELREFLDNALGPEALSKCVVVVETSDAPPLLRVRAALTATTIAEVFRDQGKRVLLLTDSLTRFLQAQREIGLMLGEPPTSKGYTPSCFSMLAELLERAGPGIDGRGSISALYTVLVEGDDLSDPVADAAISMLDGHILLDRRLAEKGLYPAINILGSVSRLANKLTAQAVQNAARSLREDLALFERMEDMVNMGAYEKGSNPNLDRVIQRLPEIVKFRRQHEDESEALQDAQDALLELMNP